MMIDRNWLCMRRTTVCFVAVWLQKWKPKHEPSPHASTLPRMDPQADLTPHAGADRFVRTLRWHELTTTIVHRPDTGAARGVDRGRHQALRAGRDRLPHAEHGGTRVAATRPPRSRRARTSGREGARGATGTHCAPSTLSLGHDNIA